MQLIKQIRFAKFQPFLKTSVFSTLGATLRKFQLNTANDHSFSFLLWDFAQISLERKVVLYILMWILFDMLFSWCDKCYINSHSNFGSISSQMVNVAFAHFTNLWQVNFMLESQPNHRFIKTADDKNLPREFEQMYRIFKVFQIPVKVWQLVMTWFTYSQLSS